MANATAKVNKAVASVTAEIFRGSSETLAAETTYYVGALVGIDETGNYCKGDDTQAWIFAGVVDNYHGNQTLPIGTAGDPKLELQLHTPKLAQLAITGVAKTDIGKTVYASDDQTGVLTPAGLTFANVVGRVHSVAGTNVAWVELAYDGVAANERLGAAKVLPATGNVTLSKFDAGKLIIIPSTGAQAITLPSAADVGIGRKMYFSKTTSNTVAATLTGAGAETINGSNTLATIDAQYDTHTLAVVGAAAWQRLASIIA